MAMQPLTLTHSAPITNARSAPLYPFILIESLQGRAFAPRDVSSRVSLTVNLTSVEFTTPNWRAQASTML